MTGDDFRRTSDEAARLGHPSYVWRAGQERRLALVRRWASLEGAAILDVGCGVGMYTLQFAPLQPARRGGRGGDRGGARRRAGGAWIVLLAPGEHLPLACRYVSISSSRTK